MRKIWIIAANTAKEIFRDRILYGLLLLAVFLVFLSLLLGELSFAEQSRIITDMGLLAAQIGCDMLAIFVGSSLVWREIEKQTVLTLLSKPVSRFSFLAGKFIGLMLVLVVTDVLIASLLGFICHFYGTVFWYQFLICQFGILMESLLLLAFTLFFGVFCRPILTTLFTLFMWLLGHMTNDLHYFSEKSHNPALKNTGLFLSRILPNLEMFSFKESVVYGDVISRGDITNALLLWALWTIILFVAATWIFEKRDFI